MSGKLGRKHKAGLSPGRTKNTGAKKVTGKQRRLWRQKQVAHVSEDWVGDETEELEDPDFPEDEDDDFGEEDNSEVDEAERGLDDGSAQNTDLSEPSDDKDDRHDADDIIPFPSVNRAITFFVNDD